MSLKYVFPATGRSGSAYIRDLMIGCGIKCGHEEVYRIRNTNADDDEGNENGWAFTRDPDDWAHKFEAESSLALAPYLNDPPCRSATVCHIVRHPLHVVDSWRHQQGMGSFIFMGQFCPFKTHDPVSFMAGMYVAWNRYIEAQNWGDREWHTCQVENPDRCMNLLGLVLIGAPDEPAKYPATNTNTVNSERITSVDDIRDQHIRRAFINIADEYGYEL